MKKLLLTVFVLAALDLETASGDITIKKFIG